MQAWSWILTCAGLTSLYLAGRHDHRAWYVGLFTQCLWVAYAIATKQYGFIASVCAYSTVYALNIRRDRKKRRESGDEK